jgi:hypothetical protein
MLPIALLAWVALSLAAGLAIGLFLKASHPPVTRPRRAADRFATAARAQATQRERVTA